MRLAITSLVFLLLMQELYAQERSTAKLASNSTQIRLRCRATLIEDKPLYIVDGYPVAEADIQRLNPNDNVRIDILKGATAGAIYGRKGANGVVIISTKNENRSFSIRDSLTGEPIAGATVTFITKKEKPDTLMFVADSLGVVTTMGLRKQQAYDVFISSVGYKSTSRINSMLVAGRTDEIKLQRNQVIGEEAIVQGAGIWRRCGGCRVGVIRVYQRIGSLKNKESFRLYPSPVLRGSSIQMEVNINESSELQLNLFSLDGKRILSNKVSLIKGLNRLSLAMDSRWTAGVYLLQLTTSNGREQWQQKLIIQ